MAEQYNPEWEYYTPSEEMQEYYDYVKYESSGFDLLGIESLRVEKYGGNIGFRFGTGKPDGASGVVRYGKEKIGRRTVETFTEKCSCGTLFTFTKRTRKSFCSHKCANKWSIAKYRKIVDWKNCLTCSTRFYQKKVDQVYCSHRCFNLTNNPNRSWTTEEEIAFAKLVSSGDSNKTIAIRLGKTVRQVRNKRYQMKKRSV